MLVWWSRWACSGFIIASLHWILGVGVYFGNDLGEWWLALPVNTSRSRYLIPFHLAYIFISFSFLLLFCFSTSSSLLPLISPSPSVSLYVTEFLLWLSCAIDGGANFLLAAALWLGIAHMQIASGSRDSATYFQLLFKSFHPDFVWFPLKPVWIGAGFRRLFCRGTLQFQHRAAETLSRLRY